ncbi:hypothetical protein Y032_0006g2836 [Ancylostoma ceylanicum]|uniref:SXP/RAL-2 family protein Ani s 5-like cation-binding domain-containing protein n=1 Tax=Ancylostoma ceylanicum TaxID=53326 RepID=A0A016VP56_9BILA|nr:hypothetical protein Y032_0006g2836 [Ancylostoma ceylanicum]
MSRLILFLLVGLVVIASSQPPPFLGGGMGPPPPPPCGLPPFIDKLPADAQQKMRHIWQNYRQGAECNNEHAQTRQLLDSLPTSVRSAIFKHGPHPPPPFGHGPPPPPPCGLPPFMDKLPADAQQKLRHIWQNYRQGSECNSEHDQTRQLLDSLPMNLRSAIFRHGPPPPFGHRLNSNVAWSAVFATYGYEGSDESDEAETLARIKLTNEFGERLKLFLLMNVPQCQDSKMVEHGMTPRINFVQGPPHPPPCGLPPFIDKLPADAQVKVREVWKNYKQGQDCNNEHSQTRQIMHSLPQEVRRKIFRPPLPPPLMKAPKDVQDKFRAIFEDRSIPFESKAKRVHELAQKVLKGDVLKEFNEFHSRMEEHRRSMKQRLVPPVPS